MSKIFIIGFGAQKGGTTWLADNLSKAGVMFPWGKEARILHHSFDEIHSGQVSSKRIQNSINHTNNSLAWVHEQNTENILKIISNPKRTRKLATTIEASEKNYRQTLNLIWRNASKGLAATGPEGYAQQVSLYMNQKEKENIPERSFNLEVPNLINQ